MNEGDREAHLRGRIASLSPDKRALLAVRLKAKSAAASEPTAVSRRQDPSAFPLSFAQERLWFLSQWVPESPVYNIPGTVHIAGRLNEGAFRKALNEVVHRHEILRSTYTISHGEPRQVILQDLTLPLPVIDLGNLPEEQREVEVQHLAREEARRPFDLSRGPLIRGMLVRLSDDLHVLLLTTHHIVADGWSTGVLVRELKVLYEAFVAERPSPLAPLPIQYADFAAWQRQWLQGSALERQLEYWRQRLSKSPPVLELPTDHPRPPISGYRGAHYSFEIPGSARADVATLAKNEGVTPFMVLLAAFHVLLHRYSGQHDICVGTPIANRNRAEVEDLIGCFVNTLVIRSDLSADPSFKELLRQVRQLTLEAYDHQDLPFEMLLDELQVQRSESYSPLFQVMFGLQDVSTLDVEMGGLRLSVSGAETETAKFDLMLLLEEAPSGYKGMLEYSTRLFESETIERMAKHYCVLLRGMVESPERRVSRLPLLEASERDTVVVKWNETGTHDDLDFCIHEFVEQQASQTPDAEALVCEGERFSYAELNSRANQLARHLRSLGVGPDVLVGVCVQRSPEMLVGQLAILKAGGAYVPIDPGYPPDRVSFMLEDAGAPILLTQESLVATLPKTRTKLVLLDAEWERIGGNSDAGLDKLTTARDLAYVLYTSGSTGQPKGVAIEHRSAIALIQWAQRTFTAEEWKGVLASTSNSFDLSVFELFATLSCGGTVILAENALQLPDIPARDEVTLINTVPSAMTELLRMGGVPDSVRTVNLAGEPLLAELVDQIYEKTSAQRVYDLYGPSEDTTYTTFALRTVQGPEVIGRPIANTRAYVLDSRLEPVPVGVPGELYVAGAGLARGYLNRPELTAERFVCDAFSGVPGERMYRTGDLVRYQPNGDIAFLGRMDHQIKLRGFRIELGEIEAALREHPDVDQVVVVAREDSPGQKYLAAYLAGNRERGPTVTALRDLLRKTLPDYMIPAVFVVLEQLPLTPNGKVDRKALPVPDGVRPDLEKEYLSPRTALERCVVGLWEAVLNLRPVGVHDDFFELGGDSIQAALLTNRLSRELGRPVELRSIYAASTVTDQCTYLREKIHDIESLIPEPWLRKGEQTARPPHTSGIDIVSRDADLPLSFAQERLWVLDQLQPGSPLYNVSGAVRLRGVLDTRIVERTLNEIVCRHEVLRSRIDTVAGEPKLQIVNQLTIPVRFQDVTRLPAAQRYEEALNLARTDAARPFDLSTAPLLRALLVRIDSRDHILVVTMHHIVADGWSNAILIREFGELYEAFSKNEPSPLPDLPIQYVDYSYWQRAMLEQDALEVEVRYWKERLSGSPPLLELPADHPRPPERTNRGALQEFALPARLSERLKQVSRREGITLFATLLAAFQTLLFRFTGQDDVNVGVPVANRNRWELEGLIGFFVNTLVLRTDLTGNPTFRELLHRVKATAAEALAHQALPFERVVQLLQPDRDLSHSPLFQVMFAFQPGVADVLDVSGLDVTPVLLDSGTAKFDLTVSMYEQTGGLHGFVEYDTELFEAETIERLVNHYRCLLDAAARDLDQRISRVPIILESDHRRQVVEWNDTNVDYPQNMTFHEAFEELVERMPEATAVVFNDECLSFQELNGRANRLAHHLRKLGVRAETLIGICLERSLQTMVGVLGILKAGGAYVPIESSWPRERILFMLDDAGISVLVTEEALLDRFSDAEVEVVSIAPASAGPRDENPASGAGPDNLAYVIYTSGSTGRPKGVMVSHRSVLHLATALGRFVYAGREGSLRVSLNASLAFDASVQQMVALLSGHALVIIPHEARQDGETLLEYARRTHIDVLDCVPSQLRLLLAAGLLDAINAGPSIVLPGGEAIDQETWRTLAAAQETEFFNMYGITECTVDSVVGHVRRRPDRPTIGRPVSNTRVYVLDHHGQPVPVGVSGELFIGGAGLARGYVRHPTLTADRFIPDPFGAGPGGRLYRTGDVVRYLPDGNLEFLGRSDGQVKVRGFRIELGEIEAVMEEHEGVQRAVTAVREETPGDRRLIGYLVQDHEKNVDVADLRSSLKSKLPAYMVPAAFVVLDDLPLTSSGKVDRKALPAPDQPRPELVADYLAPRSQEEEILAKIWSEVLGIKEIGVWDNFFDLGGDSILAIQVTARANVAGLRLAPRQLFQFPTISDLAAASGTGPVVEAEQGVVEGRLPLTPIQRWFLEQDLPESHHWNQGFLLESRERLDPELLELAVSALLRQHDALRLRVHKEGSDWVQTNVALDEDTPFASFDLSALSPAAQTAEIESTARRTQASLNHRYGPLVRVAHFDLGPRRNDRLMFAVHHLAIDGVSWRILLEDLQTAYELARRHDTVVLPAKTTSFKRWAERLSEAAETGEFAEECAYWTRVCEGADHRLPADFADGVNSQASEQHVVVTLTPEETRALIRDVPPTYGTEMVDALLTALLQSFAQWTGSRTLFIDVEGHGRESLFEELDVSRTVGWFTSIYPVRLTLDGLEWPGEVLKTVKEHMRRVPRRGIGYGVLRYLNTEPALAAELSSLPRPQVSFNYLGQFNELVGSDAPLTLAPESGGPSRAPTGQRPYLLSIDGGVVGGRLEMTWSYSDAIHREETIEDVAGVFMKSLRQIIEHCRTRETVGYTPSDFPDVELSQEELDIVMSEISESSSHGDT